MEGFLEANEVVEISFSKLANIKRSGDLPLRKTLMVSRVLSRAQEAASSAQDSLFSNHMNSSRCSSKLLASFANNQSNVDSLPASHQTTLKYHSREQSPIATESHDLLECVAPQQPDQEPMDLGDVNSFLDTILQDFDSKTELSHSQCQPPLQEIDNSDARALCPNASNDVFARSDSSMLPPSRPVSPGKRNYQQAFPFITEQSQSQPPYQDNLDLKRFKACTGEGFPLDSLPGFCGYLSTKNLQTAPFITYMFGKGFTHPSNLNSTFSDWPSLGHEGQDLLTSNTTVSPILAF